MVRETFGHVINGVEQQSVSGELFDDVNPWTEEVWAQIALGGKQEADADVAAAFDRSCLWRQYESGELVIDYEDTTTDVRFIQTGKH